MSEVGIVARTPLSQLVRKRAPLRARAPVTGYGGRIPTEWLVQLPGSRRWRRVYCACFSNTETCYVEVGPEKNWHVIEPG